MEPSGARSFIHRRPALAQGYADALLGIGPFDRTSGLFLTAPRRTGKTTFAKNDLGEELRARAVEVVYVDLWADRQRDPAALIADAIRAALRALDGPAVRAARRAGLAKAGLGSWASFDLDRVGAPDGPTLTDALRAVAERAGSPVALIVDEAQHALTTEAGVDAMFALKAARDALGASAEGQRLLLVMTGSHRDKLAHLVLRRDQPFFGGDVSDLPRLGRDFSDAYTAWLNARLAEGNRFEKDDVWAAFAALGQRPELLRRELERVALSEAGAPALQASLADGARALRERIWEEFDGEFGSLTPLQQAVILRIAEATVGFAPFSSASLAAYAGGTGTPVSPSEAQAAIEVLRGRNLVWKSARGSYALEDQELGEWLRARATASAGRVG